MNPNEVKRFNELYQCHLRLLKLQGKSQKTIESYSRAIRRVSEHFDCCPDQLTLEQFEIYFAKLVESHSWSTVKIDRNGLQFFWKFVLKKDWQWLNIVKPPKIHTIPDILTPAEVEQIIGATRKLRYRVFLLTTYSMGLRLEEALSLQVGDIDAGRKKVHIRRGKGHKDRIVPLPDLTLQALRELWKRHRHPHFIFPNGNGNLKTIRQATTHMDRGGTQNAMKTVVEECGIKKKSTLPSLQFCHPSSGTRPEPSSHSGPARSFQSCNNRSLCSPDGYHGKRQPDGHQFPDQQPSCRSEEGVIMDIAPIIQQYYPAFTAKYKQISLPGHLRALHAMASCRTKDCGELYVLCPGCEQAQWRPLSCGHRSCPQCQNHEVNQWIDRQQAKLLPVPYFMVTFTLPCELRSLAWNHQKAVYSILFSCAAGTLKDFGLNPKNLGAEIGMTMVLHTNSRKLDNHPHIHAVVPGGGIDKIRRQWKKKKSKYLFNIKAMAKVFRARFLTGLNDAGLPIPGNVPGEWVVDCSHVGKGITALKYLSRYLYRGVISEKNITSNQNGQITFRYIDRKTGKTRYRTLKGEDFLFLILQHVLPRGFRRVRDYGFLLCNAKRLLAVVQLVLRVFLTVIKERPRSIFKCPCCQTPMVILGFRYPALESG